MASLYKYAEAKWSKALMQSGSVRVGTLHDFRKQEHKPGVADAYEGFKDVVHAVDSWNAADEVPGRPSLDMRAMNMLGLQIDPDLFTSGKPITGGVSGITFIREINEPDCFVHCTAYKRSKEVMAEFEGVDSCVEIFNVKEFYERVTEELNSRIPVIFRGLHVIKYQPREDQCNGTDYGRPPSLIKDMSFSGQYEMRAVWHPIEPQLITPQNLEVSDLKRCCRKIRIE